MTDQTVFVLDRRLQALVASERQTVISFLLELTEFARGELHLELGYPSLYNYCHRHLGLSRASAFRRAEVAGLMIRCPVVSKVVQEGTVTLRSLVALREVINEANCAEVLARARGLTEEQAELLALDYRPRRAPAGEVVRPLTSYEQELVSAGTGQRSYPASLRESAQPVTRDLRRLAVTVSADFMAELGEVRSALSHKIPDGDFEKVVREGFRLLLDRHRKAKGLTEKPLATRRPTRSKRHVPAAVKREVFARDKGACTWPMADGSTCGSKVRLEFDHIVEVAAGGEATPDNIRLLCRSHNQRKAEQVCGAEFMAQFKRSDAAVEGAPRWEESPDVPAAGRPKDS
jgi:hypothetical protein